jgi:uncharacterized membrane protein
MFHVQQNKAATFVGVVFVAAGANHFINPAPYLAIMPRYLPWHEALNYASGVAEIAGGVGAMFPMTRVWAGWGLMVLLVAVFPANIQMAQQSGLPGLSLPQWLLYARLPLQALLIWWVYRVCVATNQKK